MFFRFWSVNVGPWLFSTNLSKALLRPGSWTFHERFCPFHGAKETFRNVGRNCRRWTGVLRLFQNHVHASEAKESLFSLSKVTLYSIQNYLLVYNNFITRIYYFAFGFVLLRPSIFKREDFKWSNRYGIF